MTFCGWHFRTLFMATVAILLISCTSATQYSPLLSAEPEIGAVLERAPRTLRLYYAALPDVDKSSLTLTGPNGELALRGFHTMGADDLMIEINDEVVDGEYTVQWVTVVAGDPTLYQGSFNFIVDTE